MASRHVQRSSSHVRVREGPVDNFSIAVTPDVRFGIRT